MRLLAELKRRNVLRAGALYAAGAWALAQGAAQLLPVFGAPDWVTRWIIVAEIVGFPFWLAFAWFYEWTPDGFRRESEIAPDDAGIRRGGRRMDLWIVGALVLAVVLLLTDRFTAHRSANASVASANDASIAVLPLANESGEKDEQYFSDGLSEDLITALSQLEGIKVIARNSAFQFRDSQDDSRTIGAKLGVAHLVEGSVRKVGDTVRIRAELIRVADGTTLWSDHYDRPYRDLFALEDDVTHAVARAMRAQLLSGSGTPQTDRPPSGNLDAYAAYLQGVFYALEFNAESYGRAIERYDAAIALDPRYARAHAALSMATLLRSINFLDGPAVDEGYGRARAEANTALALDPDLAAAHVAHASILTYVNFDWDGSEAEYRAALKLAPGDGPAHVGLGQMRATRGHVEEAIALTREALANDPRRANWHNVLSTYLAGAGRYDEADAEMRRAIELQPNAGSYEFQRTMIAVARGDAAAALETARLEKDSLYGEIALAMALQLGGDRDAADRALAALVEHQRTSAAYQIADVYAVRGDADAVFEWLERAWANRDPGMFNLLIDPLLARYRSDPRFAAICRSAGLASAQGA